MSASSFVDGAPPKSCRGHRPACRPTMCNGDFVVSRVCAIVPSWNGRSLLPFCLDSLLVQDEPDIHAVVVDNGSSDGTPEWIATQYPRCDVVALSRNTGFAAAINSGLAMTDSPFVLVLNNDAALAPDYVRQLADFLERNPQAAACQGRVLCHDDPTQVDSLGIRFDAALMAFQSGNGCRDDRAENPPREIPGVTACAALYRRQALIEVADPGDPPAVFDPAFFAYYEDVDLALRLRQAGWTAHLVASVACEHIGSATGLKGSPRMMFLLGRNYLLYLSRHVGLIGLLRLAPRVFLQNLRRLLTPALRPRQKAAWFAGQLAAIPKLQRAILGGVRDRRRGIEIRAVR